MYSSGEQFEDDPDDEGQRTFWRLVDQHPLCVYQQRTGRSDAVKLSDFVSSRKLQRLEIYAEWFRPSGIEYVFEVGITPSLVYTKNFLFQKATADFDERDRLVLNLLRPHLSYLYRQALARRRLTSALAALERSREAVVLFDRRARIAFVTVRARRLLAAYFGEERGIEIPETLADWLRRHASRLNGEPDLHDTRGPLIVERNRGRLLVHVARAAGVGRDGVLLLEERARRQAPGAQALGLSRREWEVLGLVARGKTNAEIATMLFVSPRTVRKHLENIFEKLDVRTRTAAVARAFPIDERLQ